MIVLYSLAFCRIVVGLVFTVSSIGKTLDITQFRQTIHDFQILPFWFIDIAVVLFLCGEFTVVTLVIIGGTFLTLGFFLAIFLLLLFCIALISVLTRKIDTSCNCFGKNAKQVSRIDILRNVGFSFCAFGGYEAFTFTRNISESLSLLEWILAGIAAIVFVVIWIQFGEIVQLFRQG